MPNWLRKARQAVGNRIAGNGENNNNASNNNQENIPKIEQDNAERLMRFDKPIVDQTKTRYPLQQPKDLDEVRLVEQRARAPNADAGTFIPNLGQVFGVDLGYELTKQKENIKEWWNYFKSFVVSDKVPDTEVTFKQNQQSEHFAAAKRAALERKIRVGKAYDVEKQYYGEKKQICSKWHDNTKEYLNIRKGEEEGLVPNYSPNTGEFDSSEIRLSNKVEQMNDLCHNLQCDLGQEGASSNSIASSNSQTSNLEKLQNLQNCERLISETESKWENILVKEKLEWHEKLEIERSQSQKLASAFDEERNLYEQKVSNLTEKKNQNQNLVIDLKSDLVQCSNDLSSAQKDLSEFQNHLKEVQSKFNEALHETNSNNSSNSLELELDSPKGTLGSFTGIPVKLVDLGAVRTLLSGIQTGFESILKFPIELLNGKAAIAPNSTSGNWIIEKLAIPVFRAFLALFVLYMYFVLARVAYELVATILHNLRKPEKIVVEEESKIKNKKSQNKSVADQKWKYYSNSKANIVNNVSRGGCITIQNVFQVNLNDLFNLSELEREILLTSASPELILVKIEKERLNLEENLRTTKIPEFQNFFKKNFSKIHDFIRNPQFIATTIGIILFLLTMLDGVDPYPRKAYQAEYIFSRRGKVENPIVSELPVERIADPKRVSQALAECLAEILSDYDFNESEENLSSNDSTDLQEKGEKRHKKVRKNVGRKKAKLVRFSDLQALEEEDSGEEIQEQITIIQSNNSLGSAWRIRIK